MKQIFFYTSRRWLTIFSWDAFMGTVEEKVFPVPLAFEEKGTAKQKVFSVPLKFKKKGTAEGKVFPVPLEFEKKGTA